MKLVDLEPRWLTREDDTHFGTARSIKRADGIIFVCPKCFAENGNRRPGVHSVICWQPHVPQTTPPVPGRWKFEGAGFADLSLVAGSSSILLTPPSCGAHFFVRSGEIQMC